MRNRFLIMAAAGAMFATAPHALAADGADGSVKSIDLRTIERTIAVEPEYESTPKYCLLVFGKEKAHKVWLVQDGKSLHVDLNANGDLTEDGEKFEQGRSDYGNQYSQFTIKEIVEPRDKGEELTHKQLSIMDWGRDAAYFTIHIDGLGRQFAQATFAREAEQAPIIHFNGPLQGHIQDRGSEVLQRSKSRELYVVIGTPGLGGEDTFASIDYSKVPRDIKPRLHIEAPAKDPAAEPIQYVVILPGRC